MVWWVRQDPNPCNVVSPSIALPQNTQRKPTHPHDADARGEGEHGEDVMRQRKVVVVPPRKAVQDLCCSWFVRVRVERERRLAKKRGGGGSVRT